MFFNCFIANKHSVIVDHAVDYEYSWLQKKNGNCQNKIDTFLQFLHSVKPSHKR
jgi:hypothetical protein